MKKLFARVLTVGYLSLLFIFCLPLFASADGFPEDGKIIRFIVPNPPGGGMDLYPRTLAPFVKNHLPWKEGEVIVENIVGAGGYTGSREIFYSKPDGYTIGIVMDQVVTLPPILGQVAYFDASKYTFFGQFNNFPSMIFTNSKSRLKSFSDLKHSKNPVTYGCDMQQIANYWMMAEKMGLNMKPILGYQGSSDSRLAVLRGEVDISTSEYSSFANYHTSGELRILFHFGKGPDKRAPEVPSMLDLGYPEEIAGINTVARTIVGPQGIPDDRAEILRKAIWAALNDPGFIAICEKSKRLEPDPKTAQEAEKSTRATAAFWLKHKDQVKATMNEFGYR
ncbi:MAG: tripartite tricarboxylate transporter substrate binding protein [Deltaproteobacteria bacterium]|nr:tripartite tricarboxylate transporter substrate binding protein [Deltaproteobacteria bacterium]